MKVNIYSLLDCVAHEYGNPFLAKNDDVAVRIVRNQMRGFAPEEYKLYHLGSYETEHGTIKVNLVKQQVFGELGMVPGNVAFEKKDDVNTVVAKMNEVKNASN